MTPDETAALRQQLYNATVVGVIQPHPTLMRLRVRPDLPLPPHKPGQYTSLGLGYWEARIEGTQDETLRPGEVSRLARRAYSISSPILDDGGRQLWEPARGNWLEFYIVLMREAESRAPALTPRLFRLKEGDRMNLFPRIMGNFTLDPVQPGDTVVLLSTGTGEAPHNYFLWELFRRGHAGRILSACCVRYRKDLAYLDVHEALMRRHPNYTYLSLTTREADADKCKYYIQDLIRSGELEKKLGAPLDPSRTHVFLCGNPKMIGNPRKDPKTGERRYPEPPGVIEILEMRGFRADQVHHKVVGNVHFEAFW